MRLSSRRNRSTFSALASLIALAVVASGCASITPGENIALIRLDNNGEFDTTFSDDGWRFVFNDGIVLGVGARPNYEATISRENYSLAVNSLNQSIVMGRQGLIGGCSEGFRAYVFDNAGAWVSEDDGFVREDTLDLAEIGGANDCLVDGTAEATTEHVGASKGSNAFLAIGGAGATSRALIFRFNPRIGFSREFARVGAAEPSRSFGTATGGQHLDADDSLSLIYTAATFSMGGHNDGVPLLKLDRDGLPDPTFGSGGEFIFSHPAFPARSVVYELRGLRRDSIGRIVVFFDVRGTTGPTIFRHFLARVTPAGALDTTFGNAGFVEVATPETRAYRIQFREHSLAIRGDDSILVFQQNSDFSSRYTTAGTLDTTYGRGGHASFVGPDLGRIATIRKLLPGGDAKTYVWGSDGSEHFVTRLLNNGSVDTSFGTAGFTRIPRAPAGRDVDVADMALTNGLMPKVVLLGSVERP